MLNWDWFSYFALVAVLCWIAGAWSAFKGSRLRACVCTVLGLVVFGTNPLSQFMDQTNPLAEVTHKRRLSAFCRTDYLHKVEI